MLPIAQLARAVTISVFWQGQATCPATCLAQLCTERQAQLEGGGQVSERMALLRSPGPSDAKQLANEVAAPPSPGNRHQAGTIAGGHAPLPLFPAAVDGPNSKASPDCIDLWSSIQKGCCNIFSTC